jgi:hypothetical protein
MGIISKIVSGYGDFATDNGTRHDNGTIVLVGGAILIVVLGLYAAYNLTAAVLNAVRRTVVGTAHGVVNVSRMVGHKDEVAVPVAAIPVPRTVPAAELGAGRPIARRREVAKIG